MRAVLRGVSGAVSDQRDTAGTAATGADSSSLVNGDGAVVRSSEDALGFEVLRGVGPWVMRVRWMLNGVSFIGCHGRANCSKCD